MGDGENTSLRVSVELVGLLGCPATEATQVTSTFGGRGQSQPLSQDDNDGLIEAGSVATGLLAQFPVDLLGDLPERQLIH